MNIYIESLLNGLMAYWDEEKMQLDIMFIY